MPKDKKQTEYYTAKELADKLSLNVMTIYRYIDAGKLKAYKIGKEFRIERSEFERFMNKAKTK
ncbi:MAG: helix-turn-helix domain-containing protein, partial [Candidatus Colwellbacteria bacterium]|nr:helix-turn-helix domain-containing protein [Candidatus Colwellbacteria bacterium]